MGVEPLEPTRIARVRRARPRSDNLIMDAARLSCRLRRRGPMGMGMDGIGVEEEEGGDGVPLEG